MIEVIGYSILFFILWAANTLFTVVLSGLVVISWLEKKGRIKSC